MDPFIGEIRIFAFNYPPQDWCFCNGVLLTGQQFPALYSLIGTLYGGDAKEQTFNVPNLQSQLVMGAAAMTDSSYSNLNKFSGTETVTLTPAQSPIHDHALVGEIQGQAVNQTNKPGANAVPGLVVINNKASTAFSNAQPDTTLSPQAISVFGGSSPHENRQPFMTLNFCICTNGIYPDFNS